MEAGQIPFDRENALHLAQLIRENLNAIVSEARVRYTHEYTHSTQGGVDEGGSIRWTTSNVLSIIDQLETGIIDAREYEGMNGDIVIQREALLYPIDGFMEDACSTPVFCRSSSGTGTWAIREP